MLFIFAAFAALSGAFANANESFLPPAKCGEALRPETAAPAAVFSFLQRLAPAPGEPASEAPLLASGLLFPPDSAQASARERFAASGEPLDGSVRIPPGLVLERAVARAAPEPAFRLRFRTGSIRAQSSFYRNLFRRLARMARHYDWARTREAGAIVLFFDGGAVRTVRFTTSLRREIELDTMRAALSGLRHREPALTQHVVERALVVHTHPDATRLHGPPPSPLALWIAPSRYDYLNLRRVARELWRFSPAARDLPAMEGVVLPYCERGLCEDLFLQFEPGGMRQRDREIPTAF